ncbi:hypothetical protein [Streptomyces sp. NPDC059122]|uniref:hypothetical protein n=1 Tax=Streptomyces sp. NPDC059122 TaxID=3346732 RepID=UPI0036AD9535
MSLYEIAAEIGHGLLAQLPSELLVALAMAGLAAVRRRRRLGQTQAEVEGRGSRRDMPSIGWRRPRIRSATSPLDEVVVPEVDLARVEPRTAEELVEALKAAGHSENLPVAPHPTTAARHRRLDDHP